MQITLQQRPERSYGRAYAALALGALSLLPCLWILGPVAYLVGRPASGRVAALGRALGLVGSTFVLFAFMYAVATIAGVIASPR